MGFRSVVDLQSGGCGPCGVVVSSGLLKAVWTQTQALGRPGDLDVLVATAGSFTGAPHLLGPEIDRNDRSGVDELSDHDDLLCSLLHSAAQCAATRVHLCPVVRNVIRAVAQHEKREPRRWSDPAAGLALRRVT